MDKFDCLYMDMAIRVSEMSYCKRRKVGALIVSNDKHNILSYGYNGTPYGYDNECEDEKGKTKDCVIHAEMNALLKLAKDSYGNSNNAILYCTTAPCEKCAVSLIQAGISKVYYKDDYHCTNGIDILQYSGIIVTKVNTSERKL